MSTSAGATPHASPLTSVPRRRSSTTPPASSAASSSGTSPKPDHCGLRSGCLRTGRKHPSEFRVACMLARRRAHSHDNVMINVAEHTAPDASDLAGLASEQLDDLVTYVAHLSGNP